MARKQVIQTVCERCERTEYIEPEKYSELPDLKVQLGSKLAEMQVAEEPEILEPELDITFEDLCSSCTKTVRNLIDQATKKINWKRSKDGPEIEVTIPCIDPNMQGDKG